MIGIELNGQLHGKLQIHQLSHLISTLTTIALIILIHNLRFNYTILYPLTKGGKSWDPKHQN